MKKYLISIEDSHSLRLKNFYSQEVFKQQQEEFKTFGVKGVDLPVLEYFKLGVAHKERPLSPGELGCTLSHLEALKDFVESEKDLAIVFEDDAIPIGAFSLVALEQQIRALNLKKEFFLSLGGIQLVHSQKVKGRLLPQKIMDKNIIHIHPAYYKKLNSTYAYALDRSMALRLLEYHHPPKGCDHWGGFEYSSNPPNFYASYLFDHPPAEISYIEQERLYANLAGYSSSHSSVWQRILKVWLNLVLVKYSN